LYSSGQNKVPHAMVHRFNKNGKGTGPHDLYYTRAMVVPFLSISAQIRVTHTSSFLRAVTIMTALYYHR